MNPQLARLISDYQTAVRIAVALMQESGIPIPATNMVWVGTGVPNRGVLKGGIPYFKHGFGCAVELPSGPVDFDFGAQGEIDGFDAWRLVAFAGDRLHEYGFQSDAALNICFNAEVAAGALVSSGHMLFYVAA